MAGIDVHRVPKCTCEDKNKENVFEQVESTRRRLDTRTSSSTIITTTIPTPTPTMTTMTTTTMTMTMTTTTTTTVSRNYRPRGSLARVLYDKQRADERLEAYDKRQWYTVDTSKIRDDLLKLWVPLGAGPCRDQPDKATEIFLMRSTERSDSLPLQAWHSLARSALSWFISRTSINGLLGRGSMHVFSSEQFEKLMEASGFKGPWNSLVDLGAGDGATTAHVAHLFDRVYATDISPPMRWALSKRKFTVLDVDKWHEEAGPFDVILCLNLLDRCDRPNSLLRQFRRSLTAGGRLVVALVLPFSPYVEVGERGDHKPSEYLPVKGNGLEGQIAGLVDRVFAPLGLRCLAWSKLPYLCEGDLGQAYYFLDDVIFVLEAVPDTVLYNEYEDYVKEMAQDETRIGLTVV
ncbi:protein-L-histidine N-pros-methyltransferase [Vespa velutina]|uniref:protein-L-histidine N-pros-methyltransferase n=1 Tax=Vespa velutina TaxID=202808 RepID=UPI001FB50F28|nr:protein-L-histidine N-pros-methyltransferase [Vespa velutina]XP_047347677.1 protein-L-histidine N-pros-methyltransferase [Vespa velutina]XP_047347678.1 protein-L-histidine N-pros-methyltransferase [Vespa velutina]XP_047347680.1 protein-L-histidine N-pros-methyltransferase [Vespa velutina]XP_047347681.1 protein-L-histidine N-pros-methyltransferase [Vespa velutina]